MKEDKKEDGERLQTLVHSISVVVPKYKIVAEGIKRDKRLDGERLPTDDVLSF